MKLKQLSPLQREEYPHEGKLRHLVSAQFATPRGPKWGNMLVEPDRSEESILADLEKIVAEWVHLEKWADNDPSQR
jgi:hypothetical protein